MIAKVSLVISLVALGLASVALWFGRAPESDDHRCGTILYLGREQVRCVGDDTPKDYAKRHCVPLRRQEGLTLWECERR